MKEFVIVTDATCDLPADYVKKEGIDVIGMSFTIDLKTYNSDDADCISLAEFYSRMRAGSMATTALINPLTAKDACEKHLKQGKDVLYISFSSALSGSYQSAERAAEELNKQYKNKVYLIDSKCASMGEGLLVYYANKYKKAGHSAEETYAYAEGLKDKICHYFTVNDLFHLYRGGRVSKGKAMIGTVLNIKPILYTNPEGKLVPLRNAFGRKKALMGLISCMQNKIGGNKNEIVFISHGDCLEEAQYVAEKIKERFGITEFMISTIGPVVGSHSGPDTIALFFVGDNRFEEV